jgi:hypothetical protein
VSLARRRPALIAFAAFALGLLLLGLESGVLIPKDSRGVGAGIARLVSHR